MDGIYDGGLELMMMMHFDCWVEDMFVIQKMLM